MVAPLLYGLDIETDTSVDGLDPATSPIVAVALATGADGDGDTVFTGSEAGILTAVDVHLQNLPAGVIVTWNGAAFDLPFLVARARLTHTSIGLHLTHDPSIALRRAPLPGHPGAYRAAWHAHTHLDAYRAYRAAFLDPEAPGSLKVVARDRGFAPVEVDRALVHELGLDDLRRYVTSDAALARTLALARWDDMAPYADDCRLPLRT
jgi:hypothetical protein